MDIWGLLDNAFSVIVWGGLAVAIVFVIRKSRADTKRSEALFRSMFPELQPYFHPLKLIAFVRARRARKAPPGPWKNPPGLEVDTAEMLEAVDGRERVRLLDAAGALLGEFTFEDHVEGGALRVGKGKLTVNVQDPNNPRVRYWHPDREFKWKGGKWTFQSRMADRDIDSSDSSTSFSSDSSSSSSAARTAAVAGGIAAAGGAFDGGGASAAWDGAAGESGASSGPAY
jgi:uncharacterized membrane protein YgcG